MIAARWKVSPSSGARTHYQPHSRQLTLSTGTACAISINGSELQSLNFLQDVEFTSSPAQEP